MNDSKTPLLDVTQVQNMHEEPELDLKLVQYQQKRIEELENELEKRKIKRSKVNYFLFIYRRMITYYVIAFK